MELEMKGQIEEAARLFAVSWDGSSDDFERCIASHYVARHQKKGSPPCVNSG
jgi:rifampin ADP-ribosylating transferase